MSTLEDRGSDLAAAFEQDGFLIHDTPLVPAELLSRAAERVDAVVAGEGDEIAAGRGGYSRRPAEGGGLVKVDQAHLADPTLFELVSHPAIGELVARVTGADLVQLWASQLLYKPPGGEAAGSVGWHQDQNYWRTWWTGEVFTVWLAVADVTADMGPLMFVRGSHRWGEREGGDFFDSDLQKLQQRLRTDGEAWEEVAGTLPAGGITMHHKLTLHGSAPNVGRRPRRGLALHLRTERSAGAPDSPTAYVDYVEDHSISPVLYQRSST